jgi:hypothetical protein
VVHERRTDFFGEIDDNSIKIELLGDSSFELEFPDGKKIKANYGR